MSGGVKAGPQITEALQVLAGLLYVTSPDPATDEGRMHLKAFDLLPALLGMNEDEVRQHCEEMYRRHGQSLMLSTGAVAMPNPDGLWGIEDAEDEVFLTLTDIKRLAEAAGVIV